MGIHIDQSKSAQQHLLTVTEICQCPPFESVQDNARKTDKVQAFLIIMIPGLRAAPHNVYRYANLVVSPLTCHWWVWLQPSA